MKLEAWVALPVKITPPLWTLTVKAPVIATAATRMAYGATLAVRAVAAVTEQSAQEIEGIIASLRAGCEKVCGKLQQLADAIRGQGDEASEHVTRYCDRASEAVQGARKLHENFKRPHIEMLEKQSPVDSGEEPVGDGAK